MVNIFLYATTFTYNLNKYFIIGIQINPTSISSILNHFINFLSLELEISYVIFSYTLANFYHIKRHAIGYFSNKFSSEFI